jgi:hypothetical protein
VAGLPALLEHLAAQEIAVALATSAPELNVAHTLGEVGLTAAFPTIVGGDQVASVLAGGGAVRPALVDVAVGDKAIVDIRLRGCAPCDSRRPPPRRHRFDWTAWRGALNQIVGARLRFEGRDGPGICTQTPSRRQQGAWSRTWSPQGPALGAGPIPA